MFMCTFGTFLFKKGVIFLAIGGEYPLTSVGWRWIGLKHGNLSVKIVPFHQINVLFVRDMRMFSEGINRATTWCHRFTDSFNL